MSREHKMKKVGSKAPRFQLPDKDEKLLDISRIRASATVIFFYPKDSTPGCTIEVQEFNRDIKKFHALGVSVIGISGGDAKSKTKFCAQNKITYPLLSDGDFKVATKFGVYGKKSFMGRTFNGIKRTTFIVNNKGKIVQVFEKVKPLGHSQEVLKKLKALLSN